MPAKTPLASDEVDAPAAYAVPFRSYFGGIETEREMLASACLYSLYAWFSDYEYVPLLRRYSWSKLYDGAQMVTFC